MLVHEVQALGHGLSSFPESQRVAKVGDSCVKMRVAGNPHLTDCSGERPMSPFCPTWQAAFKAAQVLARTCTHAGRKMWLFNPALLHQDNARESDW